MDTVPAGTSWRGERSATSLRESLGTSKLSETASRTAAPTRERRDPVAVREAERGEGRESGRRSSERNRTSRNSVVPPVAYPYLAVGWRGCREEGRRYPADSALEGGSREKKEERAVARRSLGRREREEEETEEADFFFFFPGNVTRAQWCSFSDRIRSSLAPGSSAETRESNGTAAAGVGRGDTWELTREASRRRVRSRAWERRVGEGGEEGREVEVESGGERGGERGGRGKEERKGTTEEGSRKRRRRRGNMDNMDIVGEESVGRCTSVRLQRLFVSVRRWEGNWNGERGMKC